MSQVDLPSYTWEEIQKHTADDDCWVVMYDKVLDVSKWIHEHPGGLDPIKDMAGMDITSSFESIGHTSTALVGSKAMIIGKVAEGSKKVNMADLAKTAAPKWSETNKEELLKYKAGGEIIPPWLIAAILLAIFAVLYLLW